MKFLHVVICHFGRHSIKGAWTCEKIHCPYNDFFFILLSDKIVKQPITTLPFLFIYFFLIFKLIYLFAKNKNQAF